jgi:molybdate transport system ATP-binding protein
VGREATLSIERGLQLAIRHRQGALMLDLTLEVTAPWTVLFGASGSGKTTVLRVVQGFVRPSVGRIVLDGRVLTDTAAKMFVAPHLRGIRGAAQAGRLFSGMTVRENVAFRASTEVVAEVLQLFRLTALAEKMPRALSGGEQQRISVARAVASAVTEESLLLLDEPFAGMDMGLRDEVAVELRDWLAGRGVPVVSVTHDVGEVFLLGAEVIRVADGRIADQGPVERVLAAERVRLMGQLRS